MAKAERKYQKYQYDSTARAYRQRVEPLGAPTPSIPVRRPKQGTRKKIDINFGIQLTICGLVVFVCAFLYIHHYAGLRVKQVKLGELKNEKLMITNQITKLQSQINQSLDLATIEKRATEELNMTKPTPQQIVYIKLSEESYTDYAKAK